MTLPVSVIIPYHNAQAYLGEALSSVRNQTAAPAEVIIVDDGSDEAARSVLADLGAGIKFIALPRCKGPGVARNIGVEAAGQPYIAFLDADDHWLPEKLEVQYAFMRAWPELDATHTGVIVFFKDGSELWENKKPRALTAPVALANHEMPPSGMMIKRESFQRLGGFDPWFRCTQDWDLQIRMALAGYQVQFVPQALIRMRRQDHGNHSSNWRCFLAGQCLVLLKHRRSYLAELGARKWLHLFARALARAGDRQGGRLGGLLRIPRRAGV